MTHGRRPVSQIMLKPVHQLRENQVFIGHAMCAKADTDEAGLFVIRTFQVRLRVGFQNVEAAIMVGADIETHQARN